MNHLDLQSLSLVLRRMGWIRFWVQLTLGTVVVVVLAFNNIGSNLTGDSERAFGLGPGLSLTTLSFLVLLFSLWQGWLIVRVGRALNSSSAVRPTRGQTGRLLKRGLLADLLGLVFAAIGYQSLSGSLFLQTSLQAPGFFGSTASGDGSRSFIGYPVTPIEVFSVLSNTQVLFAHLVGLILSLWLLQRIYRAS